MSSGPGEHSTQETSISWTCMKTLTCTHHAKSEDILTNGSHYCLLSKTVTCTQFGEVPRKILTMAVKGTPWMCQTNKPVPKL